MALDVTPPAIPDLCWPLDTACFTAEWDALNDETQERSAYMAVQTLRMLTKERVGGCPITVRPCAEQCNIPGRSAPFFPGNGGGYSPFFPLNINGAWSNCGCGGGCGCSASCQISLPAPVGDLVEVKLNGTAVPLTDFRLDNENILVYIGTGVCPFTQPQNLNKNDTETGTWSITYVNSYLPDAVAAYAAAVLAMEFGKACTNGKCGLPSGVTAAVRNGLSMTITPGMFPDGFTGIRQVDSFIAAWNPDGANAYPAQVYSPSVGLTRTITRNFS